MAVSKSRTKKPTYILEEEGDFSRPRTNKKSEYKLRATDIFSLDDIKKCPIILTPEQEDAIKIINNNEISIIEGNPGCTKTFTSIMAALLALSTNKCERIYITKPLQVSGDEEIGILPGGVQDKSKFFMESYMDIFESILDKNIVSQLISGGFIQELLISYARGRTISKNSYLLLDEAQSVTMKGLYLISTRTNSTSRLIIIGDSAQSDLPDSKNKFDDFVNMIKDLPDVGMYKFDKSHNKRSKLVMQITEKYEEYLKNNDNKKILKG